MSQENVELLRTGYAAANRGDVEGFLVSVHPDVEFTSLIAEAEGETFRGHDGVRRWWREVVAPLGGLHGEPEQIRDLGDTLVARVTATYRPGGVEVPQTIWHVVRYQDGRAIWWQFFRTEAEALETAGLSQENVELVRRAFAEFGLSLTGVEDAARAGLVATDAELDFSALYPDGPIIRGLEAWRGFADSLPWGPSLKFEPERFIDVDDERVLVLMYVTAEGESSGVPVETRSAHEYTIQDGVITRVKVYSDQSEALEATGLSE